jgi:site-specific recombinase XerD
MKRMEMPRLDQCVPPPFSPEDIRKLLVACNRKTDTGLRDYAIMLCLLDSGLRLAEFASLRLSDVNMRTGIVRVRKGTGGKQRQTRFGGKARGALVRFLGTRQCEPGEPLWGLSARGIQIMLYRLGKRTGVRPCGPHRFRRTFALWCLRDGMDLHSLRVLMGHSDLSILQRYLALAGEDIEHAHIAHSPADTLLTGR